MSNTFSSSDLIVEAYTNKNTKIYSLDERITFFYKIENKTKDKTIFLVSLRNCISRDFLVERTSHIYNPHERAIRIGRKLSPMESVLIRIDVRAKFPNDDNQFTPTLVIRYGNDNERVIKFEKVNYSIATPNVFSIEHYLKSIAKHKRVIDIKELTEIEKKMKSNLLSILNKKRLPLPYNIAFIVYDNTKSRVVRNSKLNKVMMSLITGSSPSVKISNVTFITGQRVSGKTTFATALIYASTIAEKEAGLKSKLNQKVRSLQNKNIIQPSFSVKGFKRIIASSLRGKKEDLIKLLNREISLMSNSFDGAHSLEEAVEYCLSNNLKLEIWLDIDYYKGEKPATQIAEFINKMKKSRYENVLKLFIITHTENLAEILLKVNISEYNVISLLQYPKKRALRKIKEYTDIQYQKIIETYFFQKEDNDIFLNVPYLNALTETLIEFQNKKIGTSSQDLLHDKYLADKIAICAINKLFRQLSREFENKTSIGDIAHILPIEELLQIENSISKSPNIFWNTPRAIEFESNFAIHRFIDYIGMGKLYDEQTKILVISGAPCTGKTTIALRIGYLLWKQGILVLYIDSKNVKEKNIHEAVKKLQNMDKDFVIIIDNAQSTHEDTIMSLYNLNPYKMIIILNSAEKITNAPLQNLMFETDSNSYVSSNLFQKLIHLIYQGLAKEINLTEYDFQELVRRYVLLVAENNILEAPDLLKKGYLNRIVSEIAGKTGTSILLFLSLLRELRRKNLPLNIQSIKNITLTPFVESYLYDWIDKLKKKYDELNLLSSEKLLTILGYVSLFSQYNIPVPTDFVVQRISRLLGIDTTECVAALHALCVNNEFITPLINYRKSQNLIVIPHRVLATYLYNVFLKKANVSNLDEIDELLKLILHKDSSITEIGPNLIRYNVDLLKTVIYRVLSLNPASEEIKWKLENNEKIDLSTYYEFERKLLSNTVSELCTCFNALLRYRKEFLKHFAFSKSFQLAFAVEDIEKILIKKNLQNECINNIMKFIECVGQRSGRITRYLIQKNLQQIKEKIGNVSLPDIGCFIHKINLRDNLAAQLLTKEITSGITSKLKIANLKQIALFLDSLKHSSKKIAQEIINTNRNILLNKKLDSANLIDIADFISSILSKDQKLAEQIANRNNLAIREKLSNSQPEEIAVFIKKIAKRNKNVARNLISIHRDIMPDQI